MGISTIFNTSTTIIWCRRRSRASLCSSIHALSKTSYRRKFIEFDRQAAINRQQIRDRAVTAGAFGGEEGVQLAERGARTAEAKAVASGIISDAFRDAVGRRHGSSRSISIAQALPQLQRQMLQHWWTWIVNQALAQARLDAQEKPNKNAAFQPQEQVDRFADIVTGILGGMRGTGTTVSNVPNPTPLQSGLGAAAAVWNI